MRSTGKKVSQRLPDAGVTAVRPDVGSWRNRVAVFSLLAMTLLLPFGLWA
jgi:hypothetical protein